MRFDFSELIFDRLRKSDLSHLNGLAHLNESEKLFQSFESEEKKSTQRPFRVIDYQVCIILSILILRNFCAKLLIKVRQILFYFNDQTEILRIRQIWIFIGIVNRILNNAEKSPSVQDILPVSLFRIKMSCCFQFLELDYPWHIIDLFIIPWETISIFIDSAQPFEYKLLLPYWVFYCYSIRLHSSMLSDLSPMASFHWRKICR